MERNARSWYWTDMAKPSVPPAARPVGARSRAAGGGIGWGGVGVPVTGRVAGQGLPGITA
ncbi:hypothetical protein GCM10009546_05630 [Actinomadura livida]|uniref:Uncharacterized protein n=1 Tax=Actinomadura livida TaxID=79909 RepID=A0ABN1DL41_9ACTN|nr:hypothetical protein GCM10010208_54440 [Actinomadura livida]